MSCDLVGARLLGGYDAGNAVARENWVADVEVRTSLEDLVVAACRTDGGRDNTVAG